jgi:hypothetical protein
MKQILFSFLLLVASQWLGAQVSPQYAARLDLYHQDWLGNFSYGQLGVMDPVHVRPGVRVGIERTWISKSHFRLYQDVLVGYYHNTYEERSWTIGSDIGFEWRLWKQLSLALPIGLHYNNVKAIDVRYVYEGDKWVKAKNDDPIVHRIQVPVGLNLGWRFLPDALHPIDVFANANVALLSPWQPGAGIPFLLTKSLGLGLRVGL